MAMAGCSSNDSNTPDIADPDDQMDQGEEPTDPVDPPTDEEISRDNDELAQVLAAHIRGEFQIQHVAFEISKGRFPEGFSQTGVNETLEATGTGALGSMSYAFTYHCNLDDAAHTVVLCDGNAGHSHMLWTMTGSETVGVMSMNDMSRTVDWEIRDLIFDKARFRGPDNVAVSSSVTTNGELATYTLNMDATYEKVRYMPADAFPTFGTIDFNINAERVRGDDRRVFETAAHLAYGADGVPTVLTLDGTLNYTVDLETGTVVRQ
jgi:hypothetical protein